MSTAYASDAAILPGRPQRIGAGLKRLGLVFVWLTFATSGIVFAEPALHDVLLVGTMVLLPLLGLVVFSRGLALYALLWGAIMAMSLVSATQAVFLEEPVRHAIIGAYLVASSVVIVGFVAARPGANVRLIMSAYVVAAVIAASTGLVGYFNLLPGASELFTVDGVRASGTFKDPNVLGAFLVPPLVYVLHVLIWPGKSRPTLWVIAAPILLLGTLLTFSRGAWFNLAVSVLAYAYLTFSAAGTHRQRLKLAICVVLGAAVSIGILAAVLNVPKFAELMDERASLQPYDVGPEGRFADQKRAIGVIVTNPLGIGALEFGRIHQNDVHQVYLSMFLNAGWIGGTLYIAVILLTLWLGMRQVVKDRGGDPLSAVLLAAFIGTAAEGAVIDTDHWRHFFVIMAMIWGMALASETSVPARRRAEEAVSA